MLKKTIFRQQKAFRDMDEAVDCHSTQAYSSYDARARYNLRFLTFPRCERT